LFYGSAWQEYYATFVEGSGDFVAGRYYMGGSFRSPIPTVAKRVPVNSWTEEGGHGEVMAIDPQTGDKKWTFPMHDVTDSGILTTASELLFTGGREGYFYALDAKTGENYGRSHWGDRSSRVRSAMRPAALSTFRLRRARVCLCSV